MASISEYAASSGRIIGESGNVVNIASTIDTTRNAFVSMNVFNELLFEGKVFTGFSKYTIAAEATAYLQVKTGVDAVCFALDTIATDSDKITLVMYENPTVTDGATPISLLNRNRESTNTTTVTVYSDASGVSGGTQIDEFYAGGTYGQKIVGGEQIMGQLPFRLKANADYVIAITNGGAAEANVLLRFSIIED